MKVWKRLLVALLLVCSLGVAAPTSRYDSADPAHRDFIEYWVAAHLLASHSNPYDRAAIRDLERRNGWIGESALVARNPPWALWFMLPLALTGITTGWILWMAASIAAFLVSVRTCWHVSGSGDPQKKSLYLLWAVAFPPVLACLMAAQVGLFLLLGFLLFLRWHETRPFWAGAALLLPLAKPHLLFPFFVVLAFWILRNRRWKLASGVLVAVAAASLIAISFDPAVFEHYFRGMRSEAVAEEFIPSLSGTIRAVLFPRFAWVQFVPLLCGLVWALDFYRRKKNWDWRRDGLTLTLVSLAVTPYSFFFDDCLALPIVLLAVDRLTKAGLRAGVLAWSLLAPTAVLLFMVIGNVSLTSGFYFWSILLWSAWSLFTRASQTSMETESVPLSLSAAKAAK